MHQIPIMIYGTAWKEEKTSELVKKAIDVGFTAIDTANQKKHYREDYLGNALLELSKLGVKRESLFLQTKFTYQNGQDHRLPYNPEDSFTDQVKSSFASSLKNLHTNYIDSFLLHGPSSGYGLTESDFEVWRAIEDLHQSGQAKIIGVSNVGIQHLKVLMKNAKVKPTMVQNRCFAQRGWDQGVREFCLSNNITYQGFSLLTANMHVLTHSTLKSIATRLNVTPQQVIFRFCKQIGILPITGTTNEQHMREDLKITEFELTQNDIDTIFLI
ncbi:MAG: aldo/keto reductase [Oligoflexia bacterium]|nr:aldo/keto reductase [Oligoflexia bacterium]